MFDFHTHLDFYSDMEMNSVCGSIIENNIITYAASVNPESFEKNCLIKKRLNKIALEKGISEKEADSLVTVTFGVHPSYCKNLPVSEQEIDSFLGPFYKASQIISEIGLDYFWEKECPPSVQLNHLLVALQYAEEGKKICVLHTKGAEKEINDILKDFPHVTPVIHWYDGPIEVYKKFVEKGYYQTFGCELKYSERIKKFLKITPKSLILPETDNPTGEPWLGGTDSSPLLIRRIYEDIGRELFMGFDEVNELLEKNLNCLLRK